MKVLNNMSYEWRSTSIKIILALFFISLLLFAFSFVNHTAYTGESFAKDYNLPIGQSMFEGDSILGENQSIQVPLLGNLPFMAHQIKSLDLQGILITLTTGTVPFDFTTISTEGIDSYGKAQGFEGPGYLTYEGNQLAVKAPHTYVWGYSAPYKILTKTSDGVDVVENGTVVESIPTSEIKNTDFGGNYYNTTTIQNWYNYDSDKSNFTLERGIVNFSDGRNNISAGNVSIIFGDNVSDYVAAYPDGTPIVLYMGNVTEEDGEVYSTSLGSHPEYGDGVREFNARSFVDAWNNTVIPPNSSGNGKAYIDFGSASDSNAPGGSASHGVCPPARVLRAAVLAEGFGLPVGMCGDNDAVLFGFNPSEDIKVTNNHDYPVKIVMWTEGSGTGMAIYGKIERFIPS